MTPDLFYLIASIENMADVSIAIEPIQKHQDAIEQLNMAGLIEPHEAFARVIEIDHAFIVKVKEIKKSMLN
jgi:hypothetical protein